jgi:hypothetical protein
MVISIRSSASWLRDSMGVHPRRHSLVHPGEDRRDSRGHSKVLLLKECRNANAKDVVKAEYESTAALYAAAPVNVPKPYTYGSFDSDMMRYVVIVRLIRLELTPTACWSSSRHGK